MSHSVLGKALLAVQQGFQELGTPYMLIGGLAVILRGFPRHTDDIDVTVPGAEIDIARLIEILGKHGFEPRIDNALDFAKHNQVLLLRHTETTVELDVAMAWLPFEDEALRQAESLEVEGVSVPVARAEDLLIYKAVAWRERDRRDIAELLRLHRTDIDLDRVRAIVEQFAEAMDEPERVSDLELLISS